jgi:hypothetical protein
VDLTPQPAALGHEPAVTAETDGAEARRLARRRAACLPPEARPAPMSARAEADARHENDRPAGAGRARTHGAGPAGRPESWPALQSDPPAGLIRLRFADASALEGAGAAFAAGSGPGFGDAWSDPATLTLQIAGDAGVETLRAVLAVLDAAAITAESLTVHTHELDDVFAAFTSLP